METFLSVMKWGGLIIVGLMAIYTIGRILSMSIFKSYFDARKDSENTNRR